jgi:glycine/D-amino acid oxidase-like deaminating enzyme/nitrite reductase/ring-hydroxylating ferredoxin subunit
MSQRRSVWLTDDKAQADPLVGAETCDALVVGAGITGVTAALLLRRRGLDVVLLEAHQVGSGTTGGTTGKLTSQHGLIYKDLAERHGRDVARAYAEANQEAIQLIRSLDDQTGADSGFTSASAIVYDRTGSDSEMLRTEYETALDLGLPARLTDDTGLPFEVSLALEFSEQAYFHPVRYCRGLIREFQRLGGRLYEGTRALGLDESGDRVEVESHGGSVVADHAVVATLLPFVDRGGFFAKTKPWRAYGVAARFRSPPPPHMYISSSGPVRSLRPWPDGGPTGAIIVGENHPTGDESADPGRWGELERWANENFEVDSFEFRWSAQDYDTADGIPYIGRSPLTERVLVATGFAKWGLTNGTAAAAILADLVVGVQNPVAEAFGASRIGDLKAVTELVRLNTATAVGLVRDRIGRISLPAAVELERGQAAIVSADDEAVAVYRDPAGELHGVSPTCTHLGCGIRWNDAENTWDCPCHGSRFDISGFVLNGPATEPLEQVQVDT